MSCCPGGDPLKCPNKCDDCKGEGKYVGLTETSDCKKCGGQGCTCPKAGPIVVAPPSYDVYGDYAGGGFLKTENRIRGKRANSIICDDYEVPEPKPILELIRGIRCLKNIERDLRPKVVRAAFEHVIAERFSDVCRVQKGDNTVQMMNGYRGHLRSYCCTISGTHSLPAQLQRIIDFFTLTAFRYVEYDGRLVETLVIGEEIIVRDDDFEGSGSCVMMYSTVENWNAPRNLRRR